MIIQHKYNEVVTVLDSIYQLTVISDPIYIMGAGERRFENA
jgi:hypothetical protein